MVPPIDYLIIGHLSYDITPSGARIGGTVSYAAVTAKAFNKSVGIVTSWGAEPELDLGELKYLPIYSQLSNRSTTFQNIILPHGRKQILSHCAKPIDIKDIPDEWQKSPIIHLGPIVNEIPPEMVSSFSPKLLGITPQGWFRSWNDDGIVYPLEWDIFLRSDYFRYLAHADVVIISDEDVGFVNSRIDDLANQCKLLVVTQGAKGATVYCQGKSFRYDAPKVIEIDPIGAGDVFASTFFIMFYETQDVHRSTEVAVKISAFSVTRDGQRSAPTQEEIKTVLER